MADYDVQALSLATPPQAAPVSSYRPAVRVRNNGIHPADVTGTLRIYRREPPGDLLETHPVSLASLAAGAEGNAQSSGYWTPTVADIGREYLFIASVTTDQDQEPDNDNLAPVTVIVTAAEPPPPPPVTAHATQHETGGADQVDIEGLHGVAADGQTPAAHKLSHQASGTDILNVTGLLGVLLESQPIADHHASHEDGGGDELYVAGLHGELADNQPAIVHDNAKHDPNYATVTELGNHLADTTEVHEVATNLEHVANKGKANGYAGLGAGGFVPTTQLGVYVAGVQDTHALRKNQSYGPSIPLEHATSHEVAGVDVISIAGLSGKAADAQDPTTHAATHGVAGNDTISIAGLSGEAADPQRTDFALDSDHGVAVEHDAGEVTLATLSVPSVDWHDNVVFEFVLHGRADMAATDVNGNLKLRIRENGTERAIASIKPGAAADFHLVARGLYFAADPSVISAFMSIIGQDQTAPTPVTAVRVSTAGTSGLRPTTTTPLTLTAEWTAAIDPTFLMVHNVCIFQQGHKP